MSQSAAQWARSMIECGADENNIVEINMNGMKTSMALWDMAAQADLSDLMDRQTAKLLQMPSKDAGSSWYKP